MSQQQAVLILQGGGALGAYQAGVYEHLHKIEQPIEWVIGTSIGAINSALIAGNPPEKRVDQLRGFWDSLSPNAIHRDNFWSALSPWPSMFTNMSTFNPLNTFNALNTFNNFNNTNNFNPLGTMMNGVDGFFKPRFGATWDINAKVPLEQTGFYDTTPLKATLEKYVDFDYLNDSPIRISVSAVDIDNGQCVVFDSKNETIIPEHIMASGALPPSFPAVKIGDHAYWDGGVYSNSPLEVFLNEKKQEEALCFMVDLWDPTESRPDSLAEAMSRYKSIQYASRAKEQLMMHKQLQDMQRAIRALTEHLPAAERKKKELKAIMEMGCDHTINVVHLIMKALPNDRYFKDVDFSASTVQARWQAGLRDCTRVFQHKTWLNPLPPHTGLMIHELKQEDD